MLCEEQLIKLCTIDNFLDICQVADMYNANRIKEFCAWFQRINPKVNELLFSHMQADDSSIDNYGKSTDGIDEKKLLKNSQNMFGFLDCKNLIKEDDSSMHEEEHNFAPPSSIVDKHHSDHEQSQSENIENQYNQVEINEHTDLKE